MPSDITAGRSQPAPAQEQEQAAAGFADFLPETLRRELGTRQVAEIEEAARAWAQARGRTLPVDIRFSLPLPFRGIFVNVLAGGERRSRSRQRADRARRPLATAGNVVFTACLVGVMYSGLVIGVLAFSGIVE